MSIPKILHIEPEQQSNSHSQHGCMGQNCQSQEIVATDDKTHANSICDAYYTFRQAYFPNPVPVVQPDVLNRETILAFAQYFALSIVYYTEQHKLLTQSQSLSCMPLGQASQIAQNTVRHLGNHSLALGVDRSQAYPIWKPQTVEGTNNVVYLRDMTETVLTYMVQYAHLSETEFIQSVVLLDRAVTVSHCNPCYKQLFFFSNESYSGLQFSAYPNGRAGGNITQAMRNACNSSQVQNKKPFIITKENASMALLVSVLIAHKMSNDKPLSNKWWADLFSIHLIDLTQSEIVLLRALCFSTFVNADEFVAARALMQACTSILDKKDSANATPEQTDNNEEKEIKEQSNEKHDDQPAQVSINTKTPEAQIQNSSKSEQNISDRGMTQISKQSPLKNSTKFQTNIQYSQPAQSSSILTELSQQLNKQQPGAGIGSNSETQSIGKVSNIKDSNLFNGAGTIAKSIHISNGIHKSPFNITQTLSKSSVQSTNDVIPEDNKSGQQNTNIGSSKSLQKKCPNTRIFPIKEAKDIKSGVSIVIPTTKPSQSQTSSNSSFGSIHTRTSSSVSRSGSASNTYVNINHNIPGTK
ncbi:MAG: hypothetical protein EZS28_008236 [Streblomastix strix]|uniref:Uncharacterized protein n=1 Tax=Streblomastix strix TaxID=222440 RepID=A0A5J4WMM4_9EUKA|nr:MAG: hypothetical protein EZS28_008236 [Streblomastix strix]